MFVVPDGLLSVHMHTAEGGDIQQRKVFIDGVTK